MKASRILPVSVLLTLWLSTGPLRAATDPQGEGLRTRLIHDQAYPQVPARCLFVVKEEQLPEGDIYAARFNPACMGVSSASSLLDRFLVKGRRIRWVDAAEPGHYLPYAQFLQR
ncbi:hypothetical protein [Leeia aquatica]|uniref:Uncharacterized protein n=1 Tax=Leeia aquatica TaxID=2725557 RepID=A0A847SEL5_9NEIS|nr:hypothetical protein [Leeia aquatica]NLR75638.1 hypothetical protein [Leeia aquatica]